MKSGNDAPRPADGGESDAERPRDSHARWFAKLILKGIGAFCLFVVALVVWRGLTRYGWFG